MISFFLFVRGLILLQKYLQIFTRMKPASVSEVKKILEKKSQRELLDYCMRLVKFKKENKELVTFLLFEADDISAYLEKIKQETNDLFSEINKSNVYFIKKSIRKILKNINKQIRFTLSKQAEAELLIHFCNCFNDYSIPVKKSRQLSNLHQAQLNRIEKILPSLHPDLQFDLKRQLK